MIILALDLSTKSTGYAIADDDVLLEHGFLSESSTDVIKRIFGMQNQISTIAKKYPIEKVVVEEVPPKEGSEHTRKVLMWLQAAMVFSIYNIDKNIPIEYLQSSAWRKRLGIKTGKGIHRDTLKEADINYVYEKYHFQPKNDDEADAICLLNASLTQEKELGAW